jgi:threonine aldolase
LSKGRRRVVEGASKARRVIEQQPAMRFLSRRGTRDAAAELRRLSEALAPDTEPDHYGEGAVISELEHEVAAVLGKEAAIFSISGKAAQLAALRVHADRRGRGIVAAHPRSHIVEDEKDAIGTLYGLRVARVGALATPFTAADVAAVHEPLAAVVVELPLRRAGYRVPPWDELVAIGDASRRVGAAFHLDGARLWEAAPGYGRMPAEIAALADTVYVSFYKSLQGLAGAALAGDAETVAAARVWIERAGSIPYRSYPYAVAAREGLRRELPRMAEYHARAALIAAALRDVPGVGISTDPPACNAFAVFLQGDRTALFAARDAIEETRGIQLFGPNLTATPDPRVWSFEIAVGPESLAIDVAEIRDAFMELIAQTMSPVSPSYDEVGERS